MGRPRKVKPEGEKETLFNSPLIREITIRPTPIIVDPRFGYSRPAPKPSQSKKRRGSEDSEE